MEEKYNRTITVIFYMLLAFWVAYLAAIFPETFSFDYAIKLLNEVKWVPMTYIGAKTIGPIISR